MRERLQALAEFANRLYQAIFEEDAETSKTYIQGIQELSEPGSVPIDTTGLSPDEVIAAGKSLLNNMGYEHP